MAEQQAQIGVFGGSGFYSFLQHTEQVEISTPYGDPSGPIVLGEVGGRSVAFLPRHGHEHTHDESVTSVGIEERRELDAKKLNAWLSELLQTKGADIFRMKGILNIKGQANRFVFQGVHMLFEGKPERPWKSEADRKSQLVFIGRNLDRDALNAGCRRCLA